MKHRRYLDGAGYFINDDRCSGGHLSEDDVLGCAHCQKALKRKIWIDNGGYCSQCDWELCVECATKALTEGCANFKRMFEREIEAAYVREQNARILGI
jgi:hypothetical protein